MTIKDLNQRFGCFGRISCEKSMKIIDFLLGFGLMIGVGIVGRVLAGLLVSPVIGSFTCWTGREFC